MNFLRQHWYDLGGILALSVSAYIFVNYNRLTDYHFLMWASCVSLFFHQLEEYRIVGTFPGMINTLMFKSDLPDRFPLNTQSALFVNVFFGWSIYLLAAIFSEKTIWLGMATMLVSLGNIIGHTFIFNGKGKTFYNAGLATSWLCFVPCIYFFFKIIHTENLVTDTDYFIGIPLGIAFNYFGVLKIIDWMKDKNTDYIFPQRCLLPKDRIKQ